MKNTLLIFALLIAVVGLTGCSSMNNDTTPTDTDDTVVVQPWTMDDDDMDMEDDMDDMWEEDMMWDDDMWEEEDMIWDDDMMWGDEDMVADVVVDITGVNFSYSLETIEVNEWDVVTINFTSNAGFHDWVVDEFDAATDKVEEGGTTSVTFVADQAGEFEYYCSVGAHRENGMIGTLIVNAAE